MENNLNIGDRVLISKYTSGMHTKYCSWVVSDMRKFIGGCYTIVSWYNNQPSTNFARLDTPGKRWVWHIDALTPVDRMSIKQFNSLNRN